LVAFVPAAVSVALIALVHERPQPPRPRRPAAGDTRLPRPYWRVVAFLTLFGLVNFSDALVLLRAHELGLGFVGVVGAYVLYNTSYAALSYPAGVVSDRLPRRLVFAVGLGLFAIAYLGFGIVTTPGWVWLLLPLYGGYSALTDGVGKAWVTDLLPERSVGTGLGLYQGIAGGAVLAAGIWAGLAWGQAGRLPLVVSGTAAAVLALLLALAGTRLDPGSARAAPTREPG